MMLLPAMAGAETVEIDGIWYNLDANTKQAEVTTSASFEPVIHDQASGMVADIPIMYTGSVDIPASVTYDGEEYCVTGIGENAFRSCYNLTSVTIPGSVTKIEEKAFYDCYNLTSVTIPGSVTTIGKCAFMSCTKLTSIAIPSSVTSIGHSAFSGCHKLADVSLSSGVTSIGENIFYYCSDLASLTIPNSVTSIGTMAFAGSGLKSLVIPNSVSDIGRSAFEGCRKMTSLTIGSGVKSIGHLAFNSTPALDDVFCLPEEMPVICDFEGKPGGTQIFGSGYKSYVTLHVPSSSFEAYSTTEPWNDAKSIVAFAPEEIKCATPTIAYDWGKLVFGCETEGAECVYEIKCADNGSGRGGEVSLNQTYEIRVYATLEGHYDSDVATATISWRDGQPVMEGFSSITIDGEDGRGDVNYDGKVDVADIAKILSIMAGSASRAVQAQGNYHPLLKKGKVWHEYAEDVMGNYREECIFYIHSETVEDGDTWFNVYGKSPVGNDNDFLPIGGSYYTRLKEKDGKVYENSSLLYDFTLSPGDTISSDDHIKVYATKRDTVTVNGHIFPRITIRRNEYHDGFMYGSWSINWVEGVGGSAGLIFGGGIEWGGMTGVNRGIIACYEDGNCIFRDENFYDTPSTPEKKCATPTIIYDRGKLVFGCETPDVEFVYDIRCADTGRDRGSEVHLSQTYEICVYAARDGFDNSDIATATIGWRNGQPIMEGFSSITMDGDDSRGDVNYDGKVDVADIAKILSIMSESAAE